jgi:voltage-gated potassium channel
MLSKLRTIVEETDTKSGLFFDLTVQVFILASIVVFSVETLPSLDEEIHKKIRALEAIFISIFTLEYVLRFLTAERKAKFLFSFWGIVDLVAILPFYLVSFGFAYNFIMLRALRLLRLVRILKLGRYNKSLQRISLALKIARHDLSLTLAATAVMLLIASFGIYQFEYPAQPDKFSSVFESLWWALATLTTVGYGDIYPITLGGRIFTGIILMIGLGIVALPAGIIASSITEARRQQTSREDSD